MHPHENEKIVSESLESVSKVNPDKRLKKIRDKGTLVLVVLVCAVIIALMASGSKPKTTPAAKKEMQVSTMDADNTLSKNLALLEQMKKEQEAQKEEQAKKAALANVTPAAVSQRQLRRAQPVSKEMLARMNAPTTLINNERVSAAPLAASATGEMTESVSVLATNNADSQYLSQQGEIPTVSARQLAHPDWTVPAGEMIPASLGVAMNSELPGMILAVTERNIYSLTGEHVLIPRGSRLVGQYNANVVQGQSRFLVIWNRVQLPNGVIVSINSPGADNLGRSGLMADSIDRHFIERFGTSSLLSIIGAFAATQGVNDNTQFNSAAEYRAAIAASFSQSAQQTLQRDMQIKPTLDKYQGAEITVFVSRDLDFSSVAKIPQPAGQLVRSAPWK